MSAVVSRYSLRDAGVYICVAVWFMGKGCAIEVLTRSACTFEVTSRLARNSTLLAWMMVCLTLFPFAIAFPCNQIHHFCCFPFMLSSTLRTVARSSCTSQLRQRLSSRNARRSYASVTDLSNFPKTGEHLHGFTLKRAQHVPELELSALHFQHEKTGADYLHVARDDSNNVFSIGFKTNPPDATGVPHILEHVTLCGSQK